RVAGASRPEEAAVVSRAFRDGKREPPPERVEGVRHRLQGEDDDDPRPYPTEIGEDRAHVARRHEPGAKARAHHDRHPPYPARGKREAAHAVTPFPEAMTASGHPGYHRPRPLIRPLGAGVAGPRRAGWLRREDREGRDLDQGSLPQQALDDHAGRRRIAALEELAPH